MICLKLATRTGSFQVDVDATPPDCGVANINYERKPLAVPGTWNTGTNYADSRYQLPRIDRHLCSLVKPGGTLLFVHHMPDPDKPRGHGPDFSKVMSAREALENLSPKWTIEKYEVIERGANSKHPYDELVRARKLA